MSGALTTAATLALVGLGTFVLTIAVVGLVRLPGAYLRLHGASKSGVPGVLLLLAPALWLGAGVGMRAVLVGAALLLTAPVAASAIGRAVREEERRGDEEDAG